MSDLNGNKFMHASEQQIVIKSEQQNLIEIPIFCPLLRAVHYWELLLNKNCREAGFCPLLRAFPLLRSALLRALSVLKLAGVFILHFF